MKLGEFYRYVPRSSWCNEGYAYVGKSHGGQLALVDTYWGVGTASPYEYALTADEAATAELLFDSGDYDELDRYNSSSRHKWEQYSEADRRKVTEQHGCRTVYFVRKGARPDLQTRITNAERDLAEAEAQLRSAQYSVDRRREDLARLKGEAS